MARMSSRPPFDARHEFVVTPPAGRAALSVGGAVILAGQRLDKGLVSARRLRQMYDARVLAVAPGSVLPGPARVGPRPGAIGPVDFGLPPLSPADQIAPPPRPRDDRTPPSPNPHHDDRTPPPARPRGVPRRRLSSAAA